MRLCRGPLVIFELEPAAPGLARPPRPQSEAPVRSFLEALLSRGTRQQRCFVISNELELNMYNGEGAEGSGGVRSAGGGVGQVERGVQVGVDDVGDGVRGHATHGRQQVVRQFGRRRFVQTLVRLELQIPNAGL